MNPLAYTAATEGWSLPHPESHVTRIINLDIGPAMSRRMAFLMTPEGVAAMRERAEALDAFRAEASLTNAKRLLEANERSLAVPAAPMDVREAALRDVLVGLLSSLTAAISLLERGGKKAAPSDKMFEQMLTDYRKALEAGLAALGGPDDH